MAKLNFHLSIKKLLLLGFLFVVLIAIPLTVYLVQQQQETRSQAVKNTTLSFSPSSVNAVAGEDLSFDINLSPGSNQVAIVRLVLKFDPTILSATEESFEVDPASQLSVLEGPVVGTDTLSVVLSVGSDPTKAIQTDTKIGSALFGVIDGASGSTDISFDPTTEVKSIDAADAPSENVFLSGNPATVTIQDESGESLSPTATPSPTLSGASGNSAPVCTSIGLDVPATGIAPYTITFNTSGSDTDGTIESVTFTFEPSFTEEVATGSGISTNSVDVSTTHTYNTPGIYTASAVLTDDEGATSNSVNCSQNITITDEDGNTNVASSTDNSDSNSDADTGGSIDDGSGDATGGGTDSLNDSNTGSTSGDVIPSPLPATGPEEAIVGIGVLGGLLFLIGTLLFFAL